MGQTLDASRQGKLVVMAAASIIGMQIPNVNNKANKQTNQANLANYDIHSSEEQERWDIIKTWSSHWIS